MTRRQSRRTQRALEKALFGPGPKQPRERARERATPDYLDLRFPGECGFCGNDAAMAPGHVFHCLHCGSMYPAEGESL